MRQADEQMQLEKSPTTRRLATSALCASLISFLPACAMAAEPSTLPQNWHMWFPESVTPLGDNIQSFNVFLMWVITPITLLVIGLIGWSLYRYNAKANPVPSKVSHNTKLEIIWTVVPIIILTIMAFPSIKLLYEVETVPPTAEMTIKATGNQWYWSYEYPDHDDMSFDAIMIEEEDLKPGQPRLLATDNEVVVPVNKTIRVQITAADVLHAWAVPAFGVKVDAVPGRLTETWFKATKTGTYYGQCSELCGLKHAFMPIAVKVVTQAEFDEWLKWAKNEFASAPRRKDTQLAQNRAAPAPAPAN